MGVATSLHEGNVFIFHVSESATAFYGALHIYFDQNKRDTLNQAVVCATQIPQVNTNDSFQMHIHKEFYVLSHAVFAIFFNFFCSLNRSYVRKTTIERNMSTSVHIKVIHTPGGSLSFALNGPQRRKQKKNKIKR